MNYDYKQQDPELWDAIANEENRQEHNIELIASENIVSNAVRAAQGSVLTNKYAEGYPVADITAAVSTLMSLNSWQLTVPRNYLAQNMPTCSLTQVPRRTRKYTLPS